MKQLLPAVKTFLKYFFSFYNDTNTSYTKIRLPIWQFHSDITLPIWKLLLTYWQNYTLRKEFFLMLSGPVQRSVRRVCVQECDTNGLWHEETAICRQVKWLHASISEVSSFMAICSFWRNAQSKASTASWPNSLRHKDGTVTQMCRYAPTIPTQKIKTQSLKLMLYPD